MKIEQWTTKCNNVPEFRNIIMGQLKMSQVIYLESFDKWYLSYLHKILSYLTLKFYKLLMLIMYLSPIQPLANNSQLFLIIHTLIQKISNKEEKGMNISFLNMPIHSRIETLLWKYHGRHFSAFMAPKGRWLSANLIHPILWMHQIVPRVWSLIFNKNKIVRKMGKQNILVPSFSFASVSNRT